MKLYLKFSLITILFLLFTDKTVCLATNDVLNYKIIQKEKMKQGGKLIPLIRPKYDFIKLKVALQTPEEITQENIKATLNDIISSIREIDKPDAITIYVYESEAHTKSSSPLAYVDWWPKGHSLSPDNAINIANKETYEIEYNINLPQKASEDNVISYFSESKRKEIFTELVKSQDKAQAEADRKYVTDANKIPMNQLKSYDFSKAIKNNSKEYDRLANKYKKQLLRKYKITEDELQQIRSEALKENWSLP